ncbi:MAG: thioredoxin family protein [Prochloraceae cyanobacterium]
MSENITENQNTDNRIGKILIAIVAIALSIAVFLGLQSKTGTASLEEQAQKSIPLEVALSNGKPTLTEFYANWCTTCQAMAKDLGELKQEYGDSVNFVMLNVDNSKWLPEILRYRVDGIPHFVFINEEGEAIAENIGELPGSFLEEDLDALVANAEIPHVYSQGQVSQLNSAAVDLSNDNTTDDPRSHGAQVQQ